MRQLAVSLGLGVLGLSVTPEGALATRSGSDRLDEARPERNLPPVLTVDLPPEVDAWSYELLRFVVRVSDPEGKAVTLRLLNPPGGMLFPPAESVPSPVELEARWLVHGISGGRKELWLEATDADGFSTRKMQVVNILGETDAPDLVQIGDVTGDGVLDLVVAAPGAADTGAVYVWAGGRNPKGPPTATLVHEQVTANLIQLADLTGDGVLDVLAPARGVRSPSGVPFAGAIHLWKGGKDLEGELAPAATLQRLNGRELDQLPGHWGEVGGPNILFRDVTGDGQVDLVARNPNADLVRQQSLVVDAGAIYVWQGGQPFSGIVPPTASLTVVDPRRGDMITAVCGQGMYLRDVTGDEIADVVALAPWADVDGAKDAGAIYVWAGGAGLNGNTSPSATLTVPGAFPETQLGATTGHRGIVIEDVTADGVLDLVVGTPRAWANGILESGAIYVWKGGSSLTGVLAPDATLAVPEAMPFDNLSKGTRYRFGHYAAEVTGDGRPDVIGVATSASRVDAIFAGAVYVWEGGPSLDGDLGPTAALIVPSVTHFHGLGTGGNLLLRDVSGDGGLDLIVPAVVGNDGAEDSGAVYVWRGGTTLRGVVFPDATLAPPRMEEGERLPTDVRPLWAEDVTGDGLADVIAPSPFAHVGRQPGGAIYVWEGGPTLIGRPQTKAVLGSPRGLGLERSFGFSEIEQFQITWVADVNGKGPLDVIAAATTAKVEGAEHAGALHVFPGGPRMLDNAQPAVSLTSDAPRPDDELGRGTRDFYPVAGVQIVDVTADGTADLFGTAVLADLGLATDAGAVHLWPGGMGNGPGLAPRATFASPFPNHEDFLGNVRGHGIRIVDLTGDGVHDLITLSPFLDVDGVEDTGAALLWKGPLLTAGEPTVLFVPGAAPGDLLGSF